MIRSYAIHLVASLVLIAMMLTAYHRFVILPMRRIGVIDVAAIWAIKEKQFADIVTRAGASERDRQKAMEIASDFARDLPAALEQLPQECGCLVLVRTAILAQSPDMIDLTPLLRHKLGLPG